MATARTMASKSPTGLAGKESISNQPEIFRLTPLSEREESSSLPPEVRTSRAPLSAKEQRALDHLARLFTVQEERCLAEARQDSAGGVPLREGSQVSKTSLSPSQAAAADASFIYQHIDFGVLNKCVPGFVKSHVNRNCRYLPETFILRVNFWRRRRMVGDESALKKSKKEAVVRTCTQQGTAPTAGARVGASPRPATVRASPRPATVGGSRQTAS